MPANKVMLVSSDGDSYEVEEAVALHFQTIKHKIDGGDTAILLPIPSQIISMVIDYCTRHVKAEEDLGAFDAQFVKVDHSTLVALVEGACHLQVEELIDLTSSALADALNGMNPREIRENFCKLNDWFTPTEKVIHLKSSDGRVFEVGVEVALVSQTLKQLVEDEAADTTTFTAANVTSVILAKVVEYCKRHAAAKNDVYGIQELEAFDTEFINVDRDTLFDLVAAADYLNIKSLLDLSCQAVADMMEGMTFEEIRDTINIRDGLMKEENEVVHRENARLKETEELVMRG